MFFFMRGGHFCGKEEVAATGMLTRCHFQCHFPVQFCTEHSDFGFLPFGLCSLFLTLHFLVNLFASWNFQLSLGSLSVLTE